VLNKGVFSALYCFHFFINDLDDHITSGGIKINETKIKMCKFADDIIFFAKGHVELQLMINQLATYVDMWALLLI